MPSSDEDVDSFFAAPRNLDRSAARARPTKRRKSDHPPSSSDDDDSSRDGSSDLGVLGRSSTGARKSASRTAKAKGKGKAAAPRVASTSKANSKRTNLEVTLSSSSTDSDDSDSSARRGSPRRRHHRTRGDVLPTATQTEEDGDVLRELARQNGWKGATPPRRARQREEQQQQQKEQRLRESSDRDRDRDDDSDGSSVAARSRRRTSASTEQTTVSDRSSSATKGKGKAKVPVALPPTKKKAAPAARRTAASTSTMTSTRKKRRTSASDDRSPSPQLEPLEPPEQPAPPESFWGVEARPAPKRKGAGTRLEPGVASKALRRLSEQGAMLDLAADDDDDEIDSSASGSDAGPSRYEPVAAKMKRQKEEALGVLSRLAVSSPLPGLTDARAARRGSQAQGESDEQGEADDAAAPACAERQQHAARRCRRCQGQRQGRCRGYGTLPGLSGGGAPRFPFSLRAFRLPDTRATSLQVTLSELDPHTNACLDAVNMLDSSDTQLLQAGAPPGPPAAAAPASRARTSAFRPAGAGPSTAGGGSAARTRTGPDADLAAQLFPSSSPRVSRSTTAAATAASRARDTGNSRTKGKGKALLVPDSDEAGPAPGGGADEDDFDGFIDDGALVAWDEADAALHKTVTEVVDLVDDDDDDEVIVSGPGLGPGPPSTSRAGARKRAVVGGEGAVNSARRPGPPEDGSSPPRGSIYISTLSRAYKEGCASLSSLSALSPLPL